MLKQIRKWFSGKQVNLSEMEIPSKLAIYRAATERAQAELAELHANFDKRVDEEVQRRLRKAMEQ